MAYNFRNEHAVNPEEIGEILVVKPNFARESIPSYPPGGVTRGMNTLEFNPNRTERIVLTFRNEGRGAKRELKFDLPSRLSLPFHWWMVTKGMIKV